MLLVDPDAHIGTTYGRVLRHAGYRVDVVRSGLEALERAGVLVYDAVLSDLAMPDLSGMELLRLVRERHPAIPVVLMTDTPCLASAIGAVELGAAHYLVKPVPPPELERVLGRAVLNCRLGRLKQLARKAPDVPSHRTEDDEGLEERFARALASLWPAFQPIVSWGERRVYAYESLLRVNEPSLPNPMHVLAAAERLGAVPQIGRAMRRRAALAARELPRDALLYINLHPQDFADEDLYATDTPLAALASRVVLEITERASLDEFTDIEARADALRRLGYRLAIDDLGAGYSGLTSMVHLRPEVVKIDMSLVRSVDMPGPRQQVIRSLIQLASDLGMAVICEGVETPAERDTLAGFGCDLMQGYLFGKPGPGFAGGRL